MDCVKTLSNVPITDIQNYLAECKQDFETSQLYSSARNEKFTDEDLRKSNFRSITDTKLFNLVDSILDNINRDDDAPYKYSLRRNDITHIKYETGGFFKRHRDYLSTTSNLIEEFTMLLCVTPGDDKVVGGDTIIYTFGGAKTFDTTTAGRGIIFRKDLEHEGMELTKGTKEIITANLWGVRNEQTNQVLLVTFPEEGGKGGASDNKMPSVRDVANESTSYVLPVDILSGMLSTHVEWANQAAEREGKEVPPVVTFPCRVFDFDTFGVVFKILTRSYVGEDDINAAKECLDYFGPFSRSDILVDLSVEASTESKKEIDPEGPSAKKARSSKEEDASRPEDFDSSLIICESEARMRAVASVALALGETHYVPFKMLFVEGVLECHWESMDISAVEIPMMPAAVLLGDHDNIFCLRKVLSKRSLEHHTLHDIHAKYNVFKNVPSSFLERKLSGIPADGLIKLFDVDRKEERDEIWEIEQNHMENGYGLGLKVGIQSNSDIKSSILKSVLHEVYGMVEESNKTIYLPGTTGSEDDDDDDAASTSLFHRNKGGEVVFNKMEAERASEFIASSDLEERVKAALQQKKFILPQKTDDVEEHFCNESVYGKVNILWVCGVIRMDENVGMPEKPMIADAEFDAWPSVEANDETELQTYLIRCQSALAANGFHF